MTGMRLFGPIRILIDHAGMRTDALDGLPRGQFAREKALHASTDKKDSSFCTYRPASMERSRRVQLLICPL